MTRWLQRLRRKQLPNCLREERDFNCGLDMFRESSVSELERNVRDRLSICLSESVLGVTLQLVKCLKAVGIHQWSFIYFRQ